MGDQINPQHNDAYIWLDWELSQHLLVHTPNSRSSRGGPKPSVYVPLVAESKRYGSSAASIVLYCCLFIHTTPALTLSPCYVPVQLKPALSAMEESEEEKHELTEPLIGGKGAADEEALISGNSHTRGSQKVSQARDVIYIRLSLAKLKSRPYRTIHTSAILTQTLPLSLLSLSWRPSCRPPPQPQQWPAEGDPLGGGVAHHLRLLRPRRTRRPGLRHGPGGAGVRPALLCCGDPRECGGRQPVDRPPPRVPTLPEPAGTRQGGHGESHITGQRRDRASLHFASSLIHRNAHKAHIACLAWPVCAALLRVPGVGSWWRAVSC